MLSPVKREVRVSIRHLTLILGVIMSPAEITQLVIRLLQDVDLMFKLGGW